MSDGTKIEWTDATWNVVNGCSIVSPGCTNCYAMRLAGTRLQHHPSRAGLTIDTKAGPVWTGEVRFNDKVLLDPLKWRRPRKIFVCAHGDLFHENVPDDWIDKVFAVMALAPQHVFQVLTKRPERMRTYMLEQRHGRPAPRVAQAALRIWKEGLQGLSGSGYLAVPGSEFDTPNLSCWALPNVWLGTSVEDQKRADERIPILLDTPAAVRWLSCEPLLGPVDLEQIDLPPDGVLNALTGDWLEMNGSQPYQMSGNKIDWIVAGGESGPGARPMHPDWVRSLRDQCAAAGVPFLFKQWGGWMPSPDHFGSIAACQSNGPACVAWPDGTIAHGSMENHGGLGRMLHQVAKKTAGRLLDGVQHDGYPA